MYQLKQITYTLELVAENMAQPGMTAYLFDKYLNAEVPVNLNDTTAYTFTVNANATSHATDRFKILFRPAIVLPVTFTSIKAIQFGKNVAVEWKVAVQLNIDHYELERSQNGSAFTTLASVAANNENIYTWQDENSLSGASFYRVKAVERNGHFKYTNIVKWMNNNVADPITVSPNPVQDGFINISFHTQPAGQYRISLINTNGQVVYTAVLQHSGATASKRINLPSVIGNAVFELMITTPDNITTSQRLIVGQ
jgi:hypothetical protein